MPRYSRFLALILTFLVLFAFGQPVGATTPDQISSAADRMHALGLVQGVDPVGDALGLNTNITRAQLVTVLVRAFGQDANAKLLNGATSFTDSSNHAWASGYVALAKRLIEERSGGQQGIGYPDGTFNPDGQVTAAEAVAFLMKFLGVKPDSNKTWPDDYLSGAVGAGLITSADLAAIDPDLSEPATRGLTFYLMDQAFYNTNLGNGETVYTKFVEPPAVSINDYPAVTAASQVTITGSVSKVPTEVRVGSVAATLNGQNFTATVDLQTGGNVFTVTATDNAGSTGTATVNIVRYVPEPASSIPVSPRLAAPKLSCTGVEDPYGLQVNCTVTAPKADYLLAWVQNGQAVCDPQVELCSKIVIVDDGEFLVDFYFSDPTQAVINFMAFDDQGDVSKVVSRSFAIPN